MRVAAAVLLAVIAVLPALGAPAVSLWSSAASMHPGDTVSQVITVSVPAADTITWGGLAIRYALPAGFTWGPALWTTPARWQFTDQSTNRPSAWRWDFGDGGSSSEQNPIHEYTRPGSFTVSLTVSNAAGSDTSTRRDLVQLPAVAPPVSATKPALTVTVPDLAPGKSFSACIGLTAKGSGAAQVPAPVGNGLSLVRDVLNGRRGLRRAAMELRETGA